MAGRITHAEDQLKPDPRYGDKVLSRFINCIMQDGKKAVAQRIVYMALDEIEKRTKGDPGAIDVFHRAISNVKPDVEVRSKRVGGANYQVPREVKRHRQQSLAIRWVVDNARKKKGKPLAQRLAEEFVDAYNGTGASVTWKENVHKMAEANRAYAHYAR